MVSSHVPNDPSPDERKERFLLLEYTQAQESAQYHDSLTWEVTSIIWGASTLLIGFIVEALCNAIRLSKSSSPVPLFSGFFLLGSRFT